MCHSLCISVLIQVIGSQQHKTEDNFEFYCVEQLTLHGNEVIWQGLGNFCEGKSGVL